MSDETAIIGSLKEIFVENLHVDAPSPDTDLLANGILDSFQFVELLLQLEVRFGMKMNIEDFDLEDLRTLGRIARLLARQRDAASAQ